MYFHCESKLIGLYCFPIACTQDVSEFLSTYCAHALHVISFQRNVLSYVLQTSPEKQVSNHVHVPPTRRLEREREREFSRSNSHIFLNKTFALSVYIRGMNCRWYLSVLSSKILHIDDSSKFGDGPEDVKKEHIQVSETAGKMSTVWADLNMFGT
jgi:hypothetical protein